MDGDIRAIDFCFIVQCMYQIYWQILSCLWFYLIIIVVIQNGDTALMRSSMTKHVGVVKFLLDHNADVNAVNEVRNI